MCRCGREATANGRECPSCFRERIGSVNNGYTPSRARGSMRPEENRKWDARLERYASLRRQGVQPESTKSRDIEKADRLSQATGEPFRAA